MIHQTTVAEIIIYTDAKEHQNMVFVSCFPSSKLNLRLTVLLDKTPRRHKDLQMPNQHTGLASSLVCLFIWT